METLDDDCCELEASTRHGNSSRAASIAKKLAEKKAPISIRFSDLPLDVPEIPVRYAIVVTYYVYRRNLRRCPAKLKETAYITLVRSTYGTRWSAPS